MTQAGVQTWRTDCRPGDTVAAWATTGPLLNESAAGWRMPDGWGPPRNLTRFDHPWVMNWLAGVAVPPDTRPGRYTLACRGADGADREFAVTVAAPPKEKNPIPVAHGTTAKAITAKIKSGGPAVTLKFSPGGYDLGDDEAVVIPPGVAVTLDGGGHATLTRTGESGEPLNRLVNLDAEGSSVRLRGFRLSNTDPGRYVLHGYPWSPRRVDVECCTVENAQLIQGTVSDGGSCLFRRLRFRDRAGTGEFPAGSWWNRGEFHGGGAGGWPHAYLNAGVDRCLTTSCDWFATARGPVTQGTARGNATVGCRLFGVGGSQVNGGEGFGLETRAEIARNLWLWCEAEGCSGPVISMQGSGIHHNRFEGGGVSGRLGGRGQSVYLSQNGPGTIAENTVTGFECDGPVWLEGDCRSNRVAVVVRDLPGSSGNQPPAAGYYARGLFVDRTPAGSGNDFTGCQIAGPGGTLRPAVVVTDLQPERH